MHTEVGPHSCKDLSNTGPQTQVTQPILRKGESCPECFRLTRCWAWWVHVLGRADSDSRVPPIHRLPTQHIQILSTQSFWTASSSWEANRLKMGRALASWSLLNQLLIYTRNKKAHLSHSSNPQPKKKKKRDTGVKKLMRSQKTEVIQVQCANRGTGTQKSKT